MYDLPAGRLNTEQRKRAMASFSEYIDAHDLSHKAVAAELGKPRASTIRDLTLGTFRANTDGHIRTLIQWMENHDRRRAASLEDPFVDSTTVAKLVDSTSQMVFDNGTIGIVFGPTGIGKSRCLNHVQQSTPGSILISIMSGSHHARGVAKSILRSLGRTQTKSEHATVVDRVLDALRNSGRLLIIDEAHKLSGGGLEFVRELHDNTGIPIVLGATIDLYERIVANADPDHGQLFSRVNVSLDLAQGRDVSCGGRPLFSVRDIRNLYATPTVKLSATAERYLVDVANELGFGSLRRCRMLLSGAARKARKQRAQRSKSVTVNADDLTFVAGVLAPTQTTKTTAVNTPRLGVA